MPMIFSEHMEHYDLETIFPYRSDVIPPYERIEVEYVQHSCFRFLHLASHSIREGSSIRLWHPFMPVPLTDSLLNLQLGFSIITVHCLNIEAKYFVHKNTWSYSSKLWPRDVLPSCYQKRCRVMLFSWNDGLAVTEEDSRFVKHGDHLLRLLMENRLEDPTRPIVFLCHGVGGLIVKEVSLNSAFFPLTSRKSPAC